MLGPDHRTIVIQEYAETADLTNSNPDQVTVFILPTMMGVEPDMEELSGAVKDSLRSADVYPHALKESHTQFNWGASSSGQEIIVQLLADPYIRMAAEQSVKGLSFGSASLFVQQVIKKVQRIRKHESERSKQHTENVFQDYGTDLSKAPTSVEFNLNRWVTLGKHYTANAYGLD